MAASAPPGSRIRRRTATHSWHNPQDLIPVALLARAPLYIANTNSGHEIHKEQPQLVIDAIRQVVDAVRGGSRQLAR
jgi:hypothetical protein